MRLLNIETFQLESYDDPERYPPYVILSHRWSEHEVLYEDLQELPNDKEVQDLQCKIRDMELRFENLERQFTSTNHLSAEIQCNLLQEENYAGLEGKAMIKEASSVDSDPQYPHLRRAKKKIRGWNKIRNFCKESKTLGFSYVWIDTCCINKESSSELSEAINSMFSWYSNASICIAYLSDVSSEAATKELNHSVWFSRGWTLQELIAPDDVWFYSGDWKFLGLRSAMTSRIAAITLINERVLHQGCQKLISEFNTAARFSWAAGRSTTRPEDMAYSLLGLFQVHIPIMYGEGEQAAFFRLQVQVFNVLSDHSIFAWDRGSSVWDHKFKRSNNFSILAQHVRAFRKKDSIIPTTKHLSQYKAETHLTVSYSQFVHGLRVLLLLRPYETRSYWQACLGCTIGEGEGAQLLTIILREDEPGHFMRAFETTVPVHPNLLKDKNWAMREVFISPDCPVFESPIYYRSSGWFGPMEIRLSRLEDKQVLDSGFQRISPASEVSASAEIVGPPWPKTTLSFLAKTKSALKDLTEGAEVTLNWQGFSFAYINKSINTMFVVVVSYPRSSLEAIILQPSSDELKIDIGPKARSVVLDNGWHVSIRVSPKDTVLTRVTVAATVCLHLTVIPPTPLSIGS